MIATGRRALLVVAVTLAAGCLDPAGRAAPSSVAIAISVSDVGGQTVRIERGAGATLRVPVARQWTRLDGLDGVELLGLPGDWTAVEIAGAVRVERDAGGALPWARGRYLVPTLLGIGLALFWLVALAGRESVAPVIAVMHLIAFLMFATWSGWAWWLYLLAALLLIVSSPFVHGRGAVPLGLAAVAQLIAAALVIAGPERAPGAAWAGHDAIEVTAGPTRREVALLDAGGAVLLEARPTVGRDLRLFVVWPDEPAPHAVRIRSADGGEQVLRLGARPSR